MEKAKRGRKAGYTSEKRNTPWKAKNARWPADWQALERWAIISCMIGEITPEECWKICRHGMAKKDVRAWCREKREELGR